MANESSLPIVDELRERSTVEPTLDGYLGIVDPEQFNVVGATEADEGVVGAAVLVATARENVEA